MISALMASEKGVLTMTEYIENPLSGKLRGVTYEDGKIIDVHIRDTDDVVKVFVPVRHGRLNGWISVQDRLPEVGGYVVCIAKRNPFSRFMPMVARIEKNGWVNPMTEQYISEVTHWMPIPNPPKGE